MRASSLVVLVALAGCPKRGDDELVGAQSAALATADRVWVDRARVGLDAVDRALDGAPVASDPEVVWRRVRVGVARGLVAVDVPTQRRAFATARSVGMDCLSVAPGVRRRLADGQLADAMLEVPEDRRRCALWAGYAWARWLTTWSAGAAAVDEETVRALLKRGGRAAAGDEAELERWGLALVDATGGDAHDLLTVPRRDNDDAWVWWGDVVRWVPEPDGEPPARGPVTPEERSAYARLVPPGR